MESTKKVTQSSIIMFSERKYILDRTKKLEGETPGSTIERRAT